jgi:hypothetical protein
MNTTETIDLLTKRIKTLKKEMYWAITNSVMDPHHKNDLMESIGADIEYYQNQLNSLQDQ